MGDINKKLAHPKTGGAERDLLVAGIEDALVGDLGGFAFGDGSANVDFGLGDGLLRFEGFALGGSDRFVRGVQVGEGLADVRRENDEDAAPGPSPRNAAPLPSVGRQLRQWISTRSGSMPRRPRTPGLTTMC
ncbi:hypothetical protein ACWD6R_02385 [Streptomyces sp. NPDC005151]